jgi:hypothetical protein
VLAVIGIGFVVEVTLRTEQATPLRSHRVDAMLDNLQVGGVAATAMKARGDVEAGRVSVVARVVHLHPDRDRAIDQLPRNAMGVVRP